MIHYILGLSMKTTLEIDPELLKKAMEITGTNSKKKAIELALKELIQSQRRKELVDLLGNYEDFSLTIEDLNKMRRES